MQMLRLTASGFGARAALLNALLKRLGDTRSLWIEQDAGAFSKTKLAGSFVIRAAARPFDCAVFGSQPGGLPFVPFPSRRRNVGGNMGLLLWSAESLV
jgi:hypothetical protein